MITEVKAFEDWTNDQLRAYELVNEKINEYASKKNALIKDIKYQEHHYAGEHLCVSKCNF